MGVTFYNELLNNNDTFDISAVILKETPVDILIGSNTIKKYKLFDKIPLKDDEFNQEDLEVGEGTNRCACQQGVSEKPSLTAPTEILIVTPPHRLLSHCGLNHQYLTGLEFFQKAYTF